MSFCNDKMKVVMVADRGGDSCLLDLLVSWSPPHNALLVEFYDDLRTLHICLFCGNEISFIDAFPLHEELEFAWRKSKKKMLKMFEVNSSFYLQRRWLRRFFPLPSRERTLPSTSSWQLMRWWKLQRMLMARRFVSC